MFYASNYDANRHADVRHKRVSFWTIRVLNACTIPSNNPRWLFLAKTIDWLDLSALFVYSESLLLYFPDSVRGRFIFEAE